MVSELTRRRIQKIARELNYQVDKNASNLRCQHTGTLALLFFEDPAPDDSLINPFFVSMLASITRASALRGYRARLEYLVERGIHFVRWGAAVPGQAEISVGCDNYQGGYDIARHLLDRGAQRLAFVGGISDSSPEFSERYRGYADALRASGIAPEPNLQVDAVSSEQAGHAATMALFERAADFDAIVAASDLIAIGAMKALNAHGLSVPEDVLVAGFDDIPLAAFVDPGLTTVQQDTRIAGVMLVDTLLKSIQSEPVQNRTIPVKLVLRQSTYRTITPT